MPAIFWWFRLARSLASRFEELYQDVVERLGYESGDWRPIGPTSW
jgi:hypothetical protein